MAVAWCGVTSRIDYAIGSLALALACKPAEHGSHAQADDATHPRASDVPREQAQPPALELRYALAPRNFIVHGSFGIDASSGGKRASPKRSTTPQSSSFSPVAQGVER